MIVPVQEAELNRREPVMSYYERPWFTVLMMILCFPVGVPLMWLQEAWSDSVKVILTAPYMFLFALICKKAVYAKESISCVITIGLALFLLALIVVLYISLYFRSRQFARVCRNIRESVEEYNAMNAHIEVLRNAYITAGTKDGKRNRRRNACDCPENVLQAVQKNPFRGLCKYFDIPESEYSLLRFEYISNQFGAAEDGKVASCRKLAKIRNTLGRIVPFPVMLFTDGIVEERIGLKDFDPDKEYFPVFSFRSMRPGGGYGKQFDIVLDIPTLDQFVQYLDSKVTVWEGTGEQRTLLTPSFRRYILERDRRTCRRCGNSVSKDSGLLLEVHHIIPLSKGGRTEESNLQTLCWKCNRTKGAKCSV